MVESPQELLNKICLMISAIESVYEEMLEINLPHLERYECLTWYGEAIDFLREERYFTFAIVILNALFF